MKNPFKRKANDASVPAEIQNYYQSDRSERAGVAWLLAVGTLIVTLVVALGLFFGGRFVYRKITNKQSTPTQQVNTTEAPSGESAPAADPDTTKPSTPSATPTPTPAATPSPATTSNSTTTSLPNTGPEDEFDY